MGATPSKKKNGHRNDAQIPKSKVRSRNLSPRKSTQTDPIQPPSPILVRTEVFNDKFETDTDRKLIPKGQKMSQNSKNSSENKNFNGTISFEITPSPSPVRLRPKRLTGQIESNDYHQETSLNDEQPFNHVENDLSLPNGSDLEEDSILKNLDDLLNSEIAMKSPSDRHSIAIMPEYIDYQRTPPKRINPKRKSRSSGIERSSSNVEHTKYSQIRFQKRLELTTGSPLGEIPERDYMVLEPTLKVRALSETHLADSPVTNEPFKSHLEEKLQIGLEHDFLGKYNKKSGQNLYSSSEQINHKIRRYQSHNELTYLERNLTNGNKYDNEYIADEPFNKRKVRYQERVTKAVYVSKYKKMNGTDFTAIPRAQVPKRSKSTFQLYSKF